VGLLCEAGTHSAVQLARGCQIAGMCRENHELTFRTIPLNVFAYQYFDVIFFVQANYSIPGFIINLYDPVTMQFVGTFDSPFPQYTGNANACGDTM
jgi:hypothetical protein